LAQSEVLKIVKNGLEMRKLWPPKVGGLKIQNNKPQPILEQKNPFMLICCYHNTKIICGT
jgi:hypothetical protein